MNRKEKRERKNELNILKDLITVLNQCFPELISKFNGLTDLRNQSYVKYQMKVIFIVRLMCEMKSIQEYSTYVLEAKLVVGDMVFSIGSEFVENENENVAKQDCETNAFKRLAEKVKKEYPRLRVILSGDALYASKPVMDICKANGWKYIIRFKEGAIPSLYKEFETIVKTDNESIKSDYEFVTGLDYQENKTNIIKYTDSKKGTEFVYITDLSITNKNIEETIYLGRKRWKIENEGFKNRTFDIGHLYSKDSNAIKVHYPMIQIAHIIRQLLENGTKEIKELKLKLEEISQIIAKELISHIINLTSHKKMQLRFD